MPDVALVEYWLVSVSHRTYAHYCKATYNLQHNFPSVVPSQLQSAEEECAICKEHMKVYFCHMCSRKSCPLIEQHRGRCLC